MIKISVAEEIWSEIIICHTEYVKTIVNNRLEKVVDVQGLKSKWEQSKYVNAIELIKKLFGDEKEKRNLNLTKFCISEDLEGIIEEFDRIYKGFYKENITEDEKITLEGTKEIFKYVMGYESFNEGTNKLKSSDNFRWSRHDFINKLNIKVCPYCNRNYITSYISSKEDILIGKQRKKTTADADHYYCKDSYPILAINIYNLIPSCGVCNSKMKGNKVKDKAGCHLYPYKDDSDALYFSTPFNDIGELYNFKETEIKIGLNIKPNNNFNTKNKIIKWVAQSREIFKVKGVYKIHMNVKQYNNYIEKNKIIKRALQSKKIFKLEEVYQIHNDIVFDIKEKIKNYGHGDEKYKKEFIENYKGLFSSYEEFENYSFDFLGKDPNKNPLAKLKQDIYKQIIESN
ncbi:hypothetical protein KPL40_11635 [Clostridium gasigenes]|uniref:hypothetical protein n=1 Tax=Clostridium gasigenes TaxID=94869 RepID=UPI001C0ACF8B|nr:hypothetical protein [Clostridium gasigenes]MBU3133104.1 hypothetical protein [Clostridium gasigenes]